jgi:hypothetical protein
MMCKPVRVAGGVGVAVVVLALVGTLTILEAQPVSRGWFVGSAITPSAQMPPPVDLNASMSPWTLIVLITVIGANLAGWMRFQWQWRKADADHKRARREDAAAFEQDVLRVVGSVVYSQGLDRRCEQIAERTVADRLSRGDFVRKEQLQDLRVEIERRFVETNNGVQMLSLKIDNLRDWLTEELLDRRKGDEGDATNGRRRR